MDHYANIPPALDLFVTALVLTWLTIKVHRARSAKRLSNLAKGSGITTTDAGPHQARTSCQAAPTHSTSEH